MIKYKFAYDSNQNIIDIQTLSKESKRDKFTCLGCGHEMVTVLGEKRVKHFRHKVIAEINCSPETYLHKLMKTKFYKIYQNCLENNKPFNIKILVYPICDFYEKDFLKTCQLGSYFDFHDKDFILQTYQLDPYKKEFDLTKFFKTIYMESREGSFIPDILLESNKKEKIFFEVAVTHASSQEKTNSNYRIIEFVADSEKDIEKIESCLLEESDRIKFLNFVRIQKSGLCNGKCYYGIVPFASEKLLYNTFIVYENGRSAIVRQTLDEINSLLPKILHFEYVYLSRSEESDYLYSKKISSLYKSKVVEAFENGVKIKNCFLCRYHAINKSWDRSGTIFCKFLKDTGGSNMAAECQYFRPDPQVFSQYNHSYPCQQDIKANIQEELNVQEDEYELF